MNFKLSLPVLLCVESMTLTQSLRSILSHFTKTRNVAVNPAEKKNARDLIVKTFRDHGLNTWTEEFPSNKAEVKKHWAPRITTTYQGGRDRGKKSNHTNQIRRGTQGTLSLIYKEVAGRTRVPVVGILKVHAAWQLSQEQRPLVVKSVVHSVEEHIDGIAKLIFFVTFLVLLTP